MAAFANWETAVLNDLGFPTTTANVSFLDSWQAAEGGVYANNPLNTKQPAPNMPYTGAVQQYATPAQGAAATAATITNGYYPDIVAALKSGNPASMLSSLVPDLQKWGTGSAFLANVSGTPYVPPTSPAAITATVGSIVQSLNPIGAPLAALGAFFSTRPFVLVLSALAVLWIGVAMIASHDDEDGGSKPIVVPIPA